MTKVSRQKATQLVLIGCLVALVPLVARALWWLPAFQERRVAKLPLRELETLTRKEPDNVVALLAYGRQLTQAGRYADALVPLQSAAGQAPEDGRVREAWSLAQTAGGYFTGAFGQLTQFVRTHPDNPDGRRALGRFYVMQRSYNRAIEELNEGLKRSPRDAEAWSLLAAAQRGLGESEQARQSLRKAVELRPEHSVDTLLLATLSAETGHLDEAMSLFAQAAKLAPNDPVVAQEWARALLKTAHLEDAKKAETLLLPTVTASSKDPMALYLLGKAQLAAGKPEAALTTLERAAQQLPAGTPRSTLPRNEPSQFLDPGPALEAAQACLALSRIAQAQQWRKVYAQRLAFRSEWNRLVDLVRVTPSRPNFQKLAELLARRGDDAEVAKYLARARGSAVDAPPVLVETARLLCKEGYAESAVAVARRAVLLAPRAPECHDALGEAQLAAGRGHEAAVAFAHAAGWLPAREADYKARLSAFYQRRAQAPTEAQRLYARALAYEKQTQGLPLGLDFLKETLNQATKSDPQDTDVLRALLRVLYRRGETQEALRVAAQLLAITPEDALGLALRATLLLEQPGGTPDRELLNRDLVRALKEERLAPIYYAQGVLTLQQGKPKEALPILQQALELAREEKTYLRLLETYEKLGDQASLRETQQALEKFRQEAKLLEASLQNQNPPLPQRKKNP